MSEDGTQDTTADKVEDGSGGDAVEEPLRPEGLRALQAERDAKKALKAELDALKAWKQEQEDAQKTEAQKQADEIARLKTEATTAARLRVALKKGLTESQANRLVGNTEEELLADADAYLADIKPSEDTSKSLDDAPAPKLRGGSRPGDDAGTTDPAELAKQIAALRQ